MHLLIKAIFDNKLFKLILQKYASYYPKFHIKMGLVILFAFCSVKFSSY